MRYKIGQVVRHIGQAVNVPTNSVGEVTGYDDVLTDCPVVHFPRVVGPYSSFIITRPEADLEPVEGGPELWAYLDDTSACASCSETVRDHSPQERRDCEAAHRQHLAGAV